jgi:exodeoxyribonuclease VII small subunit
MNASKNPTFESQLDALEEIVNHLEQGDLPLNDSLTQFEKGIKLTKDCQKMLSQAEQKVSLLSEDDDQLKDFE